MIVSSANPSPIMSLQVVHLIRRFHWDPEAQSRKCPLASGLSSGKPKRAQFHVCAQWGLHPDWDGGL